MIGSGAFCSQSGLTISPQCKTFAQTCANVFYIFIAQCSRPHRPSVTIIYGIFYNRQETMMPPIGGYTSRHRSPHSFDWNSAPLYFQPLCNRSELNLQGGDNADTNVANIVPKGSAVVKDKLRMKRAIAARRTQPPPAVSVFNPCPRSLCIRRRSFPPVVIRQTVFFKGFFVTQQKHPVARIAAGV